MLLGPFAVRCGGTDKARTKCLCLFLQNKTGMSMPVDMDHGIMPWMDQWHPGLEGILAGHQHH